MAATTSDHVWSDSKSDHELSTDVLIVREEERATEHWLISDEIIWLKYVVKTAKRKNCGKMTQSVAIDAHIFIQSGVIDILPKFKMVAAAILDFQVMRIWHIPACW